MVPILYVKYFAVVAQSFKKSKSRFYLILHLTKINNISKGSFPSSLMSERVRVVMIYRRKPEGKVFL